MTTCVKVASRRCKSSLQQLQKRMEALEPVNMLALEELQDLEQRLAN